jgi:D-glycero-D-manno-heptose 1,7-bisphosphate phosphatase
MATPERYEQVCADYRNGLVKAKNLREKQKAIFLDRDGTLNKHPGGLYFINNRENMTLIDGVADAVAMINNSGYLAIVVTNQPVIARGECSLDELESIHNRMERLLGEGGAYLDDIIFCPHHPDKGFEGEREEYKIQCDCRKPKPGMLLKMADKFNIDLSMSFMIGDDERDMRAGKSAGCRTCYINGDLLSANQEFSDYSSESLVDAVKWILRERD